MLRSRLPEITAELEKAAREAVAAAAELVVATAKDRAPVDTGRLRDSIHIDEEAEGTYVVAGDHEVFYGNMVEHGTVDAAAHPFLLPALEENRSAIEAAVTAAIRKVT